MSDWDNLQTILAIRRSGSIGGAARAMRINYSTVNRRLSAYEEALGSKLFERTANGQICTLSGMRICDAAERMEETLAAAERSVIGSDANMEGELRITLSASLFQTLMAPIFSAFTKRHPDIGLTLNFTRDLSNLGKREADIAFRFSNNPPESLVGVRITNCAQSIYASRQYINANPDPKSRHWIGRKDGTRLPAWVRNSSEPAAAIKHNVLDNLAKQHMAVHGMGMTILPCFLGDQNPSLIRMPSASVFPGRDLWILTHEDIRKTAKVRALLEFSREQLKAKSDLLEGLLPASGAICREIRNKR